MSAPLTEVKALLFDVFGTVVDWRGTIVEEGEALNRSMGLRVDWASFADEWRVDGYLAGINRIRRGEWPWMRVDAIHQRKLDELLVKHRITGLTEAQVDHLNRVWHRLAPWPDSVPGLSRLRKRYLIAPLSNGDFSLLTNMAKAAGLPWDCVIAAELTHHYKTDPEVYLGGVALLDLQAHEVMMVAAHNGDLLAARATGMRTGLVNRPMEYGPGGVREPQPDPPFDVVADDFLDLAAKLGA
jgi:2-haloacid dehalogenase